jgi:dTDP-4-amino-4,6-dideoxygalactose transaminase
MIVMNDFKAEPAELHERMQRAAKRVIDSGWYVLGKECETFEREWSSRCGVRHGVGVANGMDAIEIALRALGIGPGDEVVTTCMTAFATVLAILRAGATPVLADIEPDSALLSTRSVERCLSRTTKAVVLVHLYGQLRDLPAWGDLCASAGISLVEDCAQAHLASSDGKAAGSFGRVAAFSYYPTKNLGAVGDAGMLVTDDLELAERSRVLRNYGQNERYHHSLAGLNSRLDEIQAAMLREKLAWLPGFTTRRRQIAAEYRDGIANPAVTLLAPPLTEESHVHHLFVVNSEHRDALAAHLAAHDVQALKHYPVPVHRQPPCVHLKRDPVGLSVGERHAATCLSLPCHPQMSDEDVARVIEAVNAFRGP